jgi:hypothetical protein
VKITTSWGPAITVKGKDGSVTNLESDWGVKYEVERLGNPADLKSGFIVQHIRWNSEITNMREEQRSSSGEYWEAWRVPAGQNTTAHPTDFGDDNYQARSNYNRGINKVTGVVKFYEYEAEELPDFKVGAVPEAGTLPATYHWPCWWDNAGGTIHNAQTEWDAFAGHMTMTGWIGTQAVKTAYP